MGYGTICSLIATKQSTKDSHVTESKQLYRLCTANHYFIDDTSQHF